jgi:hypothetical protein
MRDFKVGDEVSIKLFGDNYDLYKVTEILDEKTSKGLTKIRLIPTDPDKAFDVSKHYVVNQNQITLSKNQLREEKLKQLGL